MPINGILVNTLKKAKSLSGSERIPVYTTTKSKPSKFTTVDDILAKVSSPTTGAIVDSLDNQTNSLQLATVNGTSLLQNIDIPVSSALNYANTFFVDPVNGNDSTGEVNRFDKPYFSYYAAGLAAIALAPTQTSPALIVLRKGTYIDYMLLRPYVYIKCEEGVVFTFGGFFDDASTGVCKIYGNACFYTNSRPLTQNYGSDIYFEFDKVDMQSTLIGWAILSSYVSGTCKLHVVCNSIDTNGSNNTIVTLRYGVEATLNVRNYIQGPRKTFSTIGMSNTIKIYCPKIVATNRTPYNAGNIQNKSCVTQQASTSTAVLEIYGDLYNLSDNFSYAPGSTGQQACLHSIQSALGAVTRVYGNLYAGDTFGIYTVYASGNDYTKYDIKGNISSKSIPICLLGAGNVVKLEGEVTKVLNDSIAGSCIYAVNSCEVYAKNTHLKNYNTVNSGIVALDNVAAKAYFYNCTAYSTGSGDKFLRDTSVGSFGCVNTKGNIPLGAAVATPVFSPQGYTQVTGVTVPNF